MPSNPLPPGFWSAQVDLPDNPDQANILKEMHTQIVIRLQTESPDADILELMMMERVCALYIALRAKEIMGAPEVKGFQTSYKAMLEQWVKMAADLRKQRVHAEELTQIRLQVVGQVASALKQALADVDPAIAQRVSSDFLAVVA